MRVFSVLALALVLALSPSVRADDLKSGPEGKIGGAFNVKAITGASKGKTFCYI
jgi:hypothetical protein